jgi:ABC-type multidrug transport system fused ATPase/permease subunit
LSLINSNGYYNEVYNYFEFTSASKFVVLLALFSLCMIIISTVMQVGRVYAVSKFALMRSHTLSHRLLSLYLRKPYEFHTMNNSSELETHVLSETQHVVMQIYRPAANLVAAVVSVVMTVTVLLLVDVKITLAALLVFSVFYLSVLLFSKRMIRALGEQRHRENKKCFGLASESLDGIKEIKANQLEGLYSSRFFDASQRMARSQVKAQILGESPNFLLQGLTFAGMIILALVLIDLGNSDGDMGSVIGESLPLLGVFAFAGQRLIPELQRIYQGYTQLQYANMSAQVLNEILKDDIVSESAEALKLKTENEALKISFKQVCYRFPNSEKDVLQDVSFDVLSGQKVGIVGATGSGKTTLVDILLGLLTPSAGAVQVNSYDITGENMKWWQSQCGYLPQDVYLLDGTIKENIIFGEDRDFNDNDLDLAIEGAHLKGFLFERDDGVESRVGEKGVQLSGGQRQRIGLARVLYKKSKVIVLDEATSALDNRTEQQLLSTLYNSVHNATIFIIAHRLESIKSCDKIIVMNNGRIVGEGSWEYLLENCEYFRSLVINK